MQTRLFAFARVAGALSSLALAVSSCGSSTMPSNPAPPSSSAPASQTYALSGVVSNASGAPIPGALLQVTNAAPHPNAGRTTTSDGDGKYTLAELARQDFDLAVSATGYVGAARNVTPGDATLVVRVEFVLAASTTSLPPPAPIVFTLSGRITSAAGAPVSGANILTSGGANAGKTTTTNSDGRYQITLAAAGLVQLTITATGFSQAERSVTLTQEQPNGTIDATLLPADTPPAAVALTGIVTRTTGQPIAGATITLASANAQNAGRTTTTNASGTYTLTGLAPGRVQVTFQANAFTTSTVTSDLATSATPVTVTLNSALVQTNAFGPAVTIGFTGVATGKTSYSGHTENGFAIAATDRPWFGSAYGVPGPAIHFDTLLGSAETGNVIVTGDGRPFAFRQVSLYSSVTKIPWAFKGLRNGTVVFQSSGTQGNTFGAFAVVTNGAANALIDRLEISVTNPLQLGSCDSPPCTNPVGVDSIVVSY
jgi:large repetitive protein